ncbi:MAG: hypothetical protein NTZ80_00745 [Patescibacteria group bacterium]|nr:hypothetical protein [Patescibacteria group bacterium]
MTKLNNYTIQVGMKGMFRTPYAIAYDEYNAYRTAAFDHSMLPVYDYPNNILEVTKSFDDNLNTRKGIIGIVYDSEGVGNISVSHKGVWAEPSKYLSDIAYGLYALHDEIFGYKEIETASKLSLLKFYMKMGYVPTSFINPFNGENIEFKEEDAKKMIEYFLRQGKEELQFFVKLNRKA